MGAGTPRAIARPDRGGALFYPVPIPCVDGTPVSFYSPVHGPAHGRSAPPLLSPPRDRRFLDVALKLYYVQPVVGYWLGLAGTNIVLGRRLNHLSLGGLVGILVNYLTPRGLWGMHLLCFTICFFRQCFIMFFEYLRLICGFE